MPEKIILEINQGEAFYYSSMLILALVRLEQAKSEKMILDGIEALSIKFDSALHNIIGKENTEDE